MEGGSNIYSLRTLRTLVRLKKPTSKLQNIGSDEAEQKPAQYNKSHERKQEQNGLTRTTDGYITSSCLPSLKSTHPRAKRLDMNHRWLHYLQLSPKLKVYTPNRPPLSAHVTMLCSHLTAISTTPQLRSASPLNFHKAHILSVPLLFSSRLYMVTHSSIL
jgi:hypothetical protein